MRGATVHGERYRGTAIAIGLLELLGNAWPEAKHVALAEQIVKQLNLDWDDCLDGRRLIRSMIHEMKNK
jgi:hypothetical protein